MDEKILEVKDMLADVTAQLDQVQASIDEARSKFPDDRQFQHKLDRRQIAVNSRRDQVKVMQALIPCS